MKARSNASGAWSGVCAQRRGPGPPRPATSPAHPSVWTCRALELRRTRPALRCQPGMVTHRSGSGLPQASAASVSGARPSGACASVPLCLCGPVCLWASGPLGLWASVHLCICAYVCLCAYAGPAGRWPPRGSRQECLSDIDANLVVLGDFGGLFARNRHVRICSRSQSASLPYVAGPQQTRSTSLPACYSSTIVRSTAAAQMHWYADNRLFVVVVGERATESSERERDRERESGRRREGYWRGVLTG